MNCDLCKHTKESDDILCGPCREMITRLSGIWPQLSIAERWVLKGTANEVPKRNGVAVQRP